MIYTVKLKNGTTKVVSQSIYEMLADALMFPHNYPELKDKVYQIDSMDTQQEEGDDTHYKEFLKMKDKYAKKGMNGKYTNEHIAEYRRKCKEKEENDRKAREKEAQEAKRTAKAP